MEARQQHLVPPRLLPGGKADAQVFRLLVVVFWRGPLLLSQLLLLQLGHRLLLRPQRQVFQPYGHGYRLLRISMFT